MSKRGVLCLKISLNQEKIIFVVKKFICLRKQQLPKMSQRILAEQLQVKGIDVDKNAIQRIESGERFVTDIELKVLAEIFHTSCDDLLK